MPKHAALLIVIFLAIVACRTDAPAPVAPAPTLAVKKSDEAPEIVKIAIRFIEFEGMTAELPAASARVKGQDKEAYYVVFSRPLDHPRRNREAVVKVYKKNGRAEWEDY